MRRTLAVTGAVFGLFTVCAPTFADSSDGIYILSASFGKLSSPHKLDITERLQSLCGSQGESCDVWCSQTSFGGRNPGRHALCRAIYRCPDGATHSAEAEREEPILMRCSAPDADDRPAMSAR
jgi:hypothetical protein